MATDILTSVHGRKLGLGSSNELVLQNPVTGDTNTVVTPWHVRGRVVATITSAQLLALNATPITVLAAPGAGLANVIDRVVVYKPAGTAYAAVAAGEDLVLKYTNASGAQVSSVIETTGFLDQATAQTRAATAPSSTGSTAGDHVVTANAAIVAHLLVGEITTGDSPLYLEIFYQTIRTAFTS
jgi:hypothetical protein